MRCSSPLAAATVCLVLSVLAPTAQAAPFTPRDDAQVLERVPLRAGTASARELKALREAVQREPRNAEAAAALAARWIDDALADGDPRFVGYAQAALAPWWSQAAPPIAVRVQRAVILQYDHRFDESLADLAAVTDAEPWQAPAWAWQAAIHMVRADYDSARRACDGLAPYTSTLSAIACTASVESLTGNAAAAASLLGDALAFGDGSREERLWALTRLAEIEERRGEFAAAERAFREALALNLPDVYLRAAYADFLLDRGRPAEVLTLLDGQERADVLLLRLALAARAAGDARAARWIDELAARFDAARARGDRTHEKEESRFALTLRGDAKRALELARDNYALQREPSDARALLEAALAVRTPEAKAAVQSVLQWLDANRVDSAALRALAERAKALP
jgi:tetratricopeptide (TPR) repeat protein